MGHRATRSRGWALALALGLLVSAAGCKPKVGGKCQVGQAVCEDTSTVLACQGGTFLEAKCRGPGGCTKLGTRVTCDDSVSQVGEVCLETDAENRACTADKKESLVCEGGKFKRAAYCRGSGGCAIHGDTVTCDQTLATKDEACTTAGANACAVDLKSRLVCRNGAWAFDRICRGGGGCAPDKQFTCDESLSEVGDPCGVSGMIVCSTDEMSELTCQGGQFMKTRSCPKEGCKVARGRVQCQ